jgi:hypothetical protein
MEALKTMGRCSDLSENYVGVKAEILEVVKRHSYVDFLAGRTRIRKACSINQPKTQTALAEK